MIKDRQGQVVRELEGQNQLLQKQAFLLLLKIIPLI